MSEVDLEQQAREASEEHTLNASGNEDENALRRASHEATDPSQGNPAPKDEGYAPVKAEDDQEPAAEQEQETVQDDNNRPNEDTVAAEWPATTNKNLQGALEMMKDAGFTPDEAGKVFEEYVKTGDASKIDLDTLKNRLGDSKASLVETGVRDFYAAEGKRNLEITRAGHEAAGGEENFHKLRDYAQAKAKTDPAFAEELEGLRGLINQNQTFARMAVQRLREVYESDPSNSTLNAKAANVQKGESKPAAPTLEPFKSRVEYGNALRKAKSAEERAVINQRWRISK